VERPSVGAGRNPAGTEKALAAANALNSIESNV